MTLAAFRAPTLPLVACVCSAPILTEALAVLLNGIAEVRRIPAATSDLRGLLRSLAPDGIVVDSEAATLAAEAIADESAAPLVHVPLHGDGLRVRLHGAWEDFPRDGSAEAVRNVLVEGIVARGAER